MNKSFTCDTESSILHINREKRKTVVVIINSNRNSSDTFRNIEHCTYCIESLRKDCDNWMLVTNRGVRFLGQVKHQQEFD